MHFNITVSINKFLHFVRFGKNKIIMVFFLIAFTTYTINFVTWTVISKHMIDSGAEE